MNKKTISNLSATEMNSQVGDSWYSGVYFLSKETGGNVQNFLLRMNAGNIQQ